MTGHDTAPRHRASNLLHHRATSSGRLTARQLAAPARTACSGRTGMTDVGRANHQDPVMTFLLMAAILGVVTSLLMRTAGRDVPRESREKQ